MTLLNCRFINLSWERGLRDSRSGRLQSAGRRALEAGSQVLRGKNFQQHELITVQVFRCPWEAIPLVSPTWMRCLEHAKLYHTYPTYPNRNFTLGAHQVMKPTSPL